MEDIADSGEADLVASIRLECETLLEQFPDLFNDVDLDVPDALPAACEHLRRRGLGRASDEAWVREIFPRAVLIVMCRAGTLYRLLELLNAEGDFETAIALARSKGCDESSAHDVVEDAVYRLVRRGHGLRSKDSLKRYFRTILFETIYDTVERVKRRRKVEVQLPESAGEPTHGPLFSLEEVRNTLLDAIQASSLPPKAIAALYLKYGAEWVAADIGRVLKLSPTTVNVWNFRSSEKLRDRLGPDRPQLHALASTATAPPEFEASIDSIPDRQARAVATLSFKFNMPVAMVASACEMTTVQVDAIRDSVRSQPATENRHVG